MRPQRLWMCAIVSALVSVMSLLTHTPHAEAFDYLEHAYLSDYACWHAQRLMAPQVARDDAAPALVARYIALGLFCPERWERPYCAADYKQLEASINRLEAPPAKSHDYAITLGDYAALPDHIARFGPIQNLPRGGDRGLLASTLWWMSRVTSAGGVIEDVSEDACETDGLAPWEVIKGDVDAYLDRHGSSGPVSIPPALLTPLARAPVKRGPSDPSSVYSFDNPHYLDLVLRNHHHFGVPAYGAWLGFHGTAIDIAARRCGQLMALSPSELGAISAVTPGYEVVSWRSLTPEQRAPLACELLDTHVRARVVAWSQRADPRLVAPVSARVAPLATSQPLHQLDPEARLRVARVTSAVMALVFEGSGLHFLQDGLASGHMRTIRTRGGLQEIRYDHNRDNAEGVVAILRTRLGSFPLVAFGDAHLLGPAWPGPRDCDWDVLAQLQPDPRHLTTCLIQNQRGVLVASTMASLLDWVLGGAGLGQSGPLGTTCEVEDPLVKFVCAHLPLRATRVAGESPLDADALGPVVTGELPVPPPPFSYESLSFKVGFDVAGRAPQLKLDVSALTELDEVANWLTSWRVGAAATLGEDTANQWFMDVGYTFHWRWAARFMIDAGPSLYAGFRGFDRDDVSFFMGLSPYAGLTILPEGWLKMPLELTVSYRAPVNLLTSSHGWLGDPLLEGHWLYVGLGLAFMR